MDISIIVIGDELLIGQVADTNSGWIARHVNPLGWNVKSIKTVADDSNEILKAIEQAFEQTDIILTTGGLGPTKDDITKMTLCKYFGGELVYDESVAKNVENVVANNHLKVNRLTASQAYVPSVCSVIQNDVGTAPIMWFENDGKVLVSMPGVPFETETMMERAVLPKLLERFSPKDYIVHRTFVVVGYTESKLAMALENFESNLPSYIHLAYLPKPNIIRLRLTGCSHDEQLIESDMETLSRSLSAILGSAIVAYEDKTLAAIIGDYLRKNSMSLATAESCTGGNIAHEITLVPGSSDYYVGSVVSYTNEIKSTLLNVNRDTLDSVGAVSEETVIQMVNGVSELLKTDCAVSTSGIAGPGGATANKPVGTVWMAAKVGNEVVTKCCHFPGNRAKVIERATTEVLLLLLGILIK